jgi:hypothetical protein
MVTFKPNVWSVEEGDEPVPANIDIRVDPTAFEAWSGKQVGQLES